MSGLSVLVCARFGKVRNLAEAEGSSTQMPASHPEGLPFGKLLASHLRRGTRPGGRSDRAWRSADFADKLGVSYRTVRNWIKGETCPFTLEPIEHELFGPSPSDDAARLELRDAFAIARQRVNLAPPASLLPPDRCFGRDGEVAALTAAVVSSPVTTAAILGSPGIGKSTLVRQVVTSTAVAERFKERRWWVELQSATDALALQAAVVLAVSLDPAVHKFPKALALLGRSPALLVLDNLETPWERDIGAVQDCLRQLAAVPNLTLLVSLRGNVALTGPAFTYQQVLGPVPDVAAQRLFLDLARHINPHDPALRSLLRDFGGVPLAIELMAIRAAPHSSLEDVWAEWQQRGIVLATHPDFREGRLTSLVRSIDLSVQSPRLHAPGQRLFWLLGQLPSGLARVDAVDLLDDNATEAKRQLLATGLAFSRGDGRMDLLPPVREFARTILLVPEHIDCNQWCTHYLDLAATHGPRVGFSDGHAATTRLKPEVANLEAAFAAAELSIMHQSGLPAALGFAEFARFSGLGSMTPLIAVSAACREAGNVTGAAQCTRSLGDVMRDRSNPELALSAYQQASQMFREVDDAFGIATCLQNSSDVAFECADYEGAWSYSEQAYRLFEKVNHAIGMATCAKTFGQVAAAQGDQATARTTIQHALDIFLTAGDKIRTADCLQTLADLSLDLFDNENAHEFYSQALPLFVEIGASLGEANCTWGLGAIALREADYDSARTAFERAQRLYRQVGSALGEANCFSELGRVFLLSGDLEKARLVCLQALTMFQHINAIRSQSACFRSFGDVLIARCDYGAACLAYEKALSLSEQDHDYFGIGMAYYLLAKMSEDAKQATYVQKAREAWTVIKRLDLLARLDKFSAAS